MYRYLLLFSIFFFTSCFNDKPKTKNPTPKEDSNSTKSDNRFLQYLETEIITEASNKKYISDLRKHQKVKLVTCEKLLIHYKDEIDGKSVELKIALKPFDKDQHKIEYKVFQGKQSNDCMTVDGVKPRGGFYDCPKTEFDKIEFSINGQSIDTGNHFDNFYNLKMCEIYQENFSPNPLLTYSKDGFFNLYMIGGKGGDSYFAKLICDEKRVVKSYVFDYNQLRDNGGFDKGFLGF